MGNKHSVSKHSVIKYSVNKNSVNKNKKESSSSAALTHQERYLVDGYIRIIENKLAFGQIIPTIINTICFKYYTVEELMILLSQNSNKNPNSIYIANITEQKSWPCQLYDYNTSKSIGLSKYDGDVRVVSAAFEIQQNISLPQILSDQIHQLYQKQNKNYYKDIKESEIDNKYNVIFSGYKDNCNAFIFDPMEFHKLGKNQNITSFVLKLPSNRKNDATLEQCEHDLVYSDYYKCLISIGGTERGQYKNSVYKLPFGDEESFDPDNINNPWRWWNMPNMNTIRSFPSCVIIKDNDGRDKIFVFGGYKTNFKSSAEIYNFETNNWRTMKNAAIARYRVGIHFDESNNCVYIGGGQGEEGVCRKIERFDCNKNEWYGNYPDTLMKHDRYPMIWRKHELLYIASVYTNCMEVLDLRERRDWIKVYDDNRLKLETVFGTEFDPKRTYQCRLLCACKI